MVGKVHSVHKIINGDTITAALGKDVIPNLGKGTRTILILLVSQLETHEVVVDNDSCLS